MLIDRLFDLFAPRILEGALGFAAAVHNAVLCRAFLLLAPRASLAHFPEIDDVAHPPNVSV
jgi:hypothetical protein